MLAKINTRLKIFVLYYDVNYSWQILVIIVNFNLTIFTPEMQMTRDIFVDISFKMATKVVSCKILQV